MGGTTTELDQVHMALMFWIYKRERAGFVYIQNFLVILDFFVSDCTRFLHTWNSSLVSDPLRFPLVSSYIASSRRIVLIHSVVASD